MFFLNYIEEDLNIRGENSNILRDARIILYHFENATL